MLQPKQSELHDALEDSIHTRLGMGGARGGAKSGGGRRVMLIRRFEYPRTTGLILRRTFPELYKSHIIKMLDEFPGLGAFYNASNKVLALPNGSRLFFGSAEHSGDMSAFYSAEFDDMMVDEAQEFSQDELERLTGSNRGTSNAEIIPKTLYTFMPGMSEAGLAPKGLPYLKRVLIDGIHKGEEQKVAWKFIQAFAWDNYEWARKILEPQGIGIEAFYSWNEKARREFFIEHTEFGRTLAAISNQGLRDAWLYGKWDTFEGQYYPQFTRGRHVITREQLLERVQPWHKKWASGDWGYDHPHAVYRHVQDERGRIITYGPEIWGRQVNEAELGKAIGRTYGKMENGKLVATDRLQSFPFSWDAGKQSNRSNPKFPKSINQMLSDALPDWMPKPFPTDASPGSRIAGARLLGQLLDSDMWQICEDCPKLIECLPSLIRDPDNPEDVLKVDFSENAIGDDPYDAVRMGLQFMLGKSGVPASVAAAAKVAEYAASRGKEVEELDVNTQAQLSRRALFQVTQKRKQRRGGLGRIWRPPIN